MLVTANLKASSSTLMGSFSRVSKMPPAGREEVRILDKNYWSSDVIHCSFLGGFAVCVCVSVVCLKVTITEFWQLYNVAQFSMYGYHIMLRRDLVLFSFKEKLDLNWLSPYLHGLNFTSWHNSAWDDLVRKMHSVHHGPIHYHSRHVKATHPIFLLLTVTLSSSTDEPHFTSVIFPINALP